MCTVRGLRREPAWRLGRPREHTSRRFRAERCCYYYPTRLRKTSLTDEYTARRTGTWARTIASRPYRVFYRLKRLGIPERCFVFPVEPTVGCINYLSRLTCTNTFEYRRRGTNADDCYVVFFFVFFSIIIFVFVMYDARHERNAQIRVVPIHAFPRRRVPVRASSRGHIDVSLSYAVYRPQTRQRFRKRNAPVSL